MTTFLIIAAIYLAIGVAIAEIGLLREEPRFSGAYLILVAGWLPLMIVALKNKSQ